MILYAPVTTRAAYVELHPAVDTGFQDECLLTEQGSGPRNVAVVLRGGPSTYLGISNLAVAVNDVNWVPLTVTSSGTVLGGPSNFSVGFASCVDAMIGPTVIANIQFFDTGETPCGKIELRPAAGYSWDCLVTCEENYETPAFIDLTVNGVYDIPGPGSEDPVCFCPAVRTQQSTWGKVKALYR
jgi:hypothetical protein